MAYRYDAGLTKRSEGQMYALSPILIGAAIYLAWLATVARRTHTEISLGQGTPNVPWWEGYAWSAFFVVAAIVVVWMARVSGKLLREQEQRQRE